MIETTPPESSEELPAPETYGAEERLADALEQLPTPEMVRTLGELLKPDELREVAEGLLIDCAQAVRKGNLLESAEGHKQLDSDGGRDYHDQRGRFSSLKKTMEEIRAKYQKTE